jgi:hypothetical protein
VLTCSIRSRTANLNPVAPCPLCAKLSRKCELRSGPKKRMSTQRQASAALTRNGAYPKFLACGHAGCMRSVATIKIAVNTKERKRVDFKVDLLIHGKTRTHSVVRECPQFLTDGRVPSPEHRSRRRSVGRPVPGWKSGNEARNSGWAFNLT